MAEDTPDFSKITEKQWLYVRYRSVGMPPMLAAKEAGYSTPHYAARDNEKHPLVRQKIAEESKKYEAEAQMSRNKVMTGLLEAIEAAKKASDPMAMIAGWREVAKMCGYYAPEVKRLELSVDQKRKVEDLRQMSDEELLRLEANLAVEGEVLSSTVN